MGMPLEVLEAMTADALAQRYGCLPTDILDADARNLKIANIVAEMNARPQQAPAPVRQGARGG